MSDRVDLAEVPLSAVRRVGELVFVSGQVPIDTKTGLTVEGSLTAQLSQVMANLEEVVRAVGAGMADVVKTTVYMTDIRDLAEMNAEYREKFLSMVPLGRLGNVQEVAEIACFMLSSSAVYITGQVIQADGGLAM